MVPVEAVDDSEDDNGADVDDVVEVTVTGLPAVPPTDSIQFVYEDNLTKAASC